MKPRGIWVESREKQKMHEADASLIQYTASEETLKNMEAILK